MVFQNFCSPGRFLTWRDTTDYLGLTIETVSRTITQFENDALIGIASTRRIVLRDRAALTKIAAHDNSTSSSWTQSNLVAERPNGESNSRCTLASM
jgi:hypothetical protein